MSTTSLPRYVELVRVSSVGQADRETPQAQRTALDALRISRPGTLVERIDVTQSATKDCDERKDIQRLAVLARAKAFDELRVRSIDRLTRHADPRQRFEVYGLLHDAGAIIVEASGNIIDPKTEQGELVFYFGTGAASKESKWRNQRTLDGKAEKARAHRLTQGPTPFARTFISGAKEPRMPDDKRWGVDEKLAKVYASMFTDYIAGRSLSQIADKLNADGVKSARGLPFTDQAVGKLLRAKSAVGEYRTKTKNGIVTFQIPAVVDAATFDHVQRLLNARSTRNAKWRHYFALLRKLLVCSECGSLMYVQPGGGGGRDHKPANLLYYFCRRCRQDGGRGYRYHRVDDVDARFHRALLGALNHPALIERFVREHDPAKSKARATADLEAARADLRKLDREEDRLATLTMKGVLPQKKGEALLAKLQAERREAQDALHAAQDRLRDTDRARAAAADLRATVEALRAAGEAADPSLWRDNLLIHVFRRGDVVIHPDGSLDVSGRIRAVFGALPSGGLPASSWSLDARGTS